MAAFAPHQSFHQYLRIFSLSFCRSFSSMQQHSSQHADRAGLLPPPPDHDPPPPSDTPCSSWVDPSDLKAAAVPPSSGFFRQLFASDQPVADELLQLPSPSVSPFDVLSSPDGLNDSTAIVIDADNRSHGLRCCVEDFNIEGAAPLADTFSLECYYTSHTTTMSHLAGESGDNRPHTVEFITPLTSISAGSCFLPFHTNNTMPMDTAAPALLLSSPDQASPSDNGCSDNQLTNTSLNPTILDTEAQGSHEEHITKKAKPNSKGEQSCNTAANSAQFQTIMSKVQSARSKEKLGERINALQQLVSPFGKTDTASVLSEAIGYIKFLQEQVQVLSSPYMTPSNSCQDLGTESRVLDLRSRGLCLVPMSCTLNVANNTNFNIGADYWASTPSLRTTGGNATVATPCSTPNSSRYSTSS